jgi:lysozyme
MRTSKRGLDLIKEFEGLRLTSYLCPAKVWTIGYGHTSAAGEPLVKRGMRITKARAEEILRADLATYEAGVLAAVSVPITQGQFDALVSFAYNCGVGALRKSTLLKRVNAKQFDRVPAEFMKWTRAGGKELPGLVRRRRAECALWRGVSDGPPATLDRAAPDEPQPTKKITQSREANAAIAAGGASAVAAIAEVAPHATSLGDALGRPALIALVVVILACAAIWWWRRERLMEEGA